MLGLAKGFSRVLLELCKNKGCLKHEAFKGRGRSSRDLSSSIIPRHLHLCPLGLLPQAGGSLLHTGLGGKTHYTCGAWGWLQWRLVRWLWQGSPEGDAALFDPWMAALCDDYFKQFC